MLKSVPEASRELGVCEQTLRRRINSGEWPALRFGRRLVRVDVDEIKKLVLKKAEEDHPPEAA